MFVQWEEASSQNKYSEKRKLEKEFRKFESGGIEFNALNFYAVWSMLAALFFGLVLFRELALIFSVGLAGLFCLPYLNIPEHFAAKRWVEHQSAPSGQGLPPNQHHLRWASQRKAELPILCLHNQPRLRRRRNRIIQS